MSKNDEFCDKNEELCIKNEELCIKNEELCIKNDGFCRCGLFDSTGIEVIPLAGDEAELEKLATSFDMGNTDCYREVDKSTIFGIIETAADGTGEHTGRQPQYNMIKGLSLREIACALAGFNKVVREMCMDAKKQSDLDSPAK